MIVSKRNYGRFVRNKFKIASSIDNKYVPIYATSFFNSQNFLEEHTAITNVFDNLFLYYRPANRANLRITDNSKYDVLLDVLKSSLTPSTYKFIYLGESYYLNCLKGYIADEKDNILLCLTSKTKIYFEENVLKHSNLRLFVSVELLKNEIYKNFYKKINSLYIEYCYENAIEVIFTTSEKIEEKLYKNSFKVEFSNLTELNEHLKEDVNSILNYTVPTLEEEPTVTELDTILNEMEAINFEESVLSSVNEETFNRIRNDAAVEYNTDMTERWTNSNNISIVDDSVDDGESTLW